MGPFSRIRSSHGTEISGYRSRPPDAQNSTVYHQIKNLTCFNILRGFGIAVAGFSMMWKVENLDVVVPQCRVYPEIKLP
jgi:hypothetical protein